MCQISEHEQRERVTGPCHPLTVIHCKTHGRFFTIYPQGFSPYGRRKLPVQEVDIETAPALEAVCDAADDETPRWPDFDDPEGVEPGWASTQWRQICRWGRWLGLSGSEAEGQRIAMALSVPLYEHAIARRRYRQGRYRHRGRAILRLLRVAGGAGGLLRRLLRAGFIAGLLGRGFEAHPGKGFLPLVPV
jgi:hypothetical protein